MKLRHYNRKGLSRLALHVSLNRNQYASKGSGNFEI